MFETQVTDSAVDSPLGRTSPLVKLGIAIVWLVGLALTLNPWPALVLAAVSFGAGVAFGALRPEQLGRRVVPIAIAALGIALANLLFSGANSDPTAHEILRLGPLRLTTEAASAAAGLAARIAAIVSVGAVFGLTTDATRLVDSLVQQARISPRFAYGALAAYQAVPRLAEDLATIRGARRLRGMAGLRPRLLVGLLVRAIRHADQLALAMDARGFGGEHRSTFRPIEWTTLDATAAFAGVVMLAAALAVGRLV
jgi:energy-coupling factor transport system permease protein